jgi:Molecular chaperone (small heat shock protein)
MNELTLFNSLFNGEVGSLLNMPVYTHTVFVPKVDVKEDGEAYTMEMDLPGRSEKDVDIELDNNTLTISSKQEEKNEMEETEKEENGRWLIRERRVSSFKRSFTLPEDVNLEALNASFKNGILTVKLPRRALSQPKKIAIKSE